MNDILSILLVIITSFMQVLFIGLQTRHFAESKILGSGITSIFISSFFIINSYYVVMEGWSHRIAYIIGCCIGSMLSIIIYNKFLNNNH
jgi:hypothetical protein